MWIECTTHDDGQTLRHYKSKIYIYAYMPFLLLLLFGAGIRNVPTWFVDSINYI